mmetsp:Transcript_51978/g.122947  ORF Transcript_51978/g.122947 Transcript_51978/m.122947 type:complete len:81 (-) Transcript_51978:69-311(-)
MISRYALFGGVSRKRLSGELAKFCFIASIPVVITLTIRRPDVLGWVINSTQYVVYPSENKRQALQDLQKDLQDVRDKANK